MRLRYENPYRKTLREHEIEPQGILFDRDRWYLVGRSLDYGEERIWRADKVHEIKVTGFAFRPERGFDVRRYLGRAWLAAAFERWFVEDERAVTRIRLTSERAATLKRDWYLPPRPLRRFGARLHHHVGAGDRPAQHPAARALARARSGAPVAGAPAPGDGGGCAAAGGPVWLSCRLSVAKAVGRHAAASLSASARLMPASDRVVPSTPS